MSFLKRLFRPSIYTRILGSFTIVIAAVIVSNIFTYGQLINIQGISQEAVPVSFEVTQTQDFGLLLQSLESGLDKYFLVRDANLKDTILSDLDQLESLGLSMQASSTEQLTDSVAVLNSKTTEFAVQARSLLDLLSTSAEAREINQQTILLLGLIDETKQAQQNLSNQVAGVVASIATSQEYIVEQSVGQIVVFAFVSVAIAVGATTVVTRSIVVPLSRLQQTSQRIASGDFSSRVALGRMDELGRLGTALNSMADQLKAIVFSLQERTRDLQAVTDVNTQISTILEVDRLLQDVVDLTKERFGLYHAHIYLLDEANRTLTLTVGAGHVGRQMVAEVRTIDMTNQQSIVASAARSRRGVIINDVRQSATFLPHPLLPNTASELAVPLVSRSELMGVLDVQSDIPGYFTQDVLGVMELLAGQVATALSNASLYEVAERTSRYERAMGNIDRQIQGAADMDEILQITVRELGKALRVPHTAIELNVSNGDRGTAMFVSDGE